MERIQQSPAVKPRKTNFTAREVEVLLNSIRKHRETVLFGVAGGRGWAKAWLEVAATVSAVEGIMRTESDVRKKWTYLKWEAKNTSKPGRDPTSRAVLEILTSGADRYHVHPQQQPQPQPQPQQQPPYHSPSTQQYQQHRHQSHVHHGHHQQQQTQQQHKQSRDTPAASPATDAATTASSRSLLEELLVPQQTPPTPTKQPVPVQPPQPPPQPQPPTQKKVQPQQAPSLKPIAPKPPQPRPVSPLQPSQPPPEVCLRWNSYHSNMQATFPSLLNNEQFVDVTLACEGRSIKCHKMMLSACSSYFEELLSQNPCQHPIVLMKDLRYWEVQALVDFMYRGEVNVGQDKLPSLLAAAEALQIKGLAGPATSAHEEDSAPSLIPLSSAEDYLEESVPSPSSARRARKRRVMSTVQSPLPPTVQSQQVPLSPSRSVVGRQRLMRPSVPSNFSHEGSSNLSEPPARRPRKSDSGEFVGEIKVEPIDIEISNDSMDNIDDAFMEKTYDGSETGDGGESSGQGDDPGGTNDIVKSGNDHRTDARQDCEQMDFGNNGMASGNDQNFNFEDGTQDGGLSSVSHMTDTGYHDSLAQPSSSGITGSGSGNIADSLLGHM